MPEDPKPIRVFISYSHDSDLLKSQVLALADKLNGAGGISCTIDQYVHPAPPEGWPQWMTYQVHHADFILMVFTKGYFEKFFRETQPGKGLGGIQECLLISNRFHNESSASNRFIPVLFADGKKDYVPLTFSGHQRYRLENKNGWDETQYEKLYYHITDQAPTPAPNSNPNIRKRPQVSRGKFPTTPKADDSKEDDSPVTPPPPGPSDETKATVYQRMLEILKSHPNIALIRDLRQALEAQGSYDETKQATDAVAHGLVYRSPQESIRLLVKVKKKNQKTLQATASSADQQENFQVASDLMGWLTLLCINHQWLERHQAFFCQATMDSKVSIPSSTKVGASTAYSATVPRKTPFALDGESKEPISEVDIYLDYLQESGFRKEYSLQEILEVVYTKIWKDAPYKLREMPSLEALKEDLAETIDMRSDDENQPVLFINLKPEEGNPIENNALFAELRKALRTMPVFFLKTQTELKALIVREHLLQSWITEFYLD